MGVRHEYVACVRVRARRPTARRVTAGVVGVVAVVTYDEKAVCHPDAVYPRLRVPVSPLTGYRRRGRRPLRINYPANFVATA
ncbi:hypothetical protein EVAR_16740_1 [Eumeta japonica]|uniref:Uncharacterized protein n=1 Tax=Eumeta variegata TaxID=151549 RepID=A0A4C1UKS3_EUMVA|nr:hypothetical protein EVAR_16740_1 [Eumeta japonica]